MEIIVAYSKADPKSLVAAAFLRVKYKEQLAKQLNMRFYRKQHMYDTSWNTAIQSSSSFVVELDRNGGIEDLNHLAELKDVPNPTDSDTWHKLMLMADNYAQLLEIDYETRCYVLNFLSTVEEKYIYSDLGTLGEAKLLPFSPVMHNNMKPSERFKLMLKDKFLASVLFKMRNVRINIKSKLQNRYYTETGPLMIDDTVKWLIPTMPVADYTLYEVIYALRDTYKAIFLYEDLSATRIWRVYTDNKHAPLISLLRQAIGEKNIVESFKENGFTCLVTHNRFMISNPGNPVNSQLVV